MFAAAVMSHVTVRNYRKRISEVSICSAMLPGDRKRGGVVSPTRHRVSAKMVRRAARASVVSVVATIRCSTSQRRNVVGSRT